MKPVYFDYAATTPCDTEVVAAMHPYFYEHFGNPGSMHAFGQKTKGAVEEARERIASFLGAAPGEIVFTSGGTESNNMAVKGVAYARRGKGNHIITSAIEHNSVLEPCHFLEKDGFEITILPVDGDGLVDPDDVRRAITDKTILISIMHANNEIGTIQPIAEIGRLARELGIYFHTDAVQTLGHLPFSVDDLNVDLLSASAHKLYGPKGIGLLYVRKGTRLTPFMHGGEQENRRRASTHNVPGIVGFGKAVEMAQGSLGEEVQTLTAFRDKLIKGFQEKMDQVKLNGHPTQRLPNNVNISIAHVEGEGMLLSLDMLGIACSTGSACSSASLAPSHVLMAIGLPHELAHGSLRFSMGRPTTAADVDRLLEVLPPVVAKLRAMSPLYRQDGNAPKAC
ncbi:MAG TPA: cysteine desulfurase NifS [Syntrophus sp. (in: bacteria)]|nr:cysteine desulfurase NifS [Syntrophus sp. (in: bacteria)]